MPELPEVETVRRGLAPALVGARFDLVEQRRANLRFPFPLDFAARLTGRHVTALRRRAKYLLADLDDGETLVMHLGMSGSFRIADSAEENTPGLFHNSRGKDGAHDHVVFHLSNGKQITYNDPRRFGLMLLIKSDLVPAHPLFRDVGIEPLGDDLDGTALARLFAGKKAPLKAALLDQRLIAGLGNIYVSEALHRAGLSPRRAAGTLMRKNRTPTASADLLAKAIHEVLDEAIVAGGSSLRDHRQANGDLGYFQHSFRVYDRAAAPCPRPGCGGTIKRIVQSGRASFYCSTCQK